MNKLNIPSILAITSILFFQCCKNPHDCPAYKNGKFIFHNNTTNVDWVIERKDSLQIETDFKNGIVVNYRVSWLNSCQYNLLELNTTRQPPNIIDSFNKINPIYVTIVETQNDYYVSLTELKIGSMKIEIKDTIRVFQ